MTSTRSDQLTTVGLRGAVVFVLAWNIARVLGVALPPSVGVRAGRVIE